MFKYKFWWYTDEWDWRCLSFCGVGNDNIGFHKSLSRIPMLASVLVGGSGADKFYIPVSSYMPLIQIHDFNPAEGANELSPSYAIYDGSRGTPLKTVVWILSLFITSRAGINLPSTTCSKEACLLSFGGVALTEFGYRLPSNPDIFLQLPQTIFNIQQAVLPVLQVQTSCMKPLIMGI